MVDETIINFFYKGWMIGWSLVVIMFLRLILEEMKNKEEKEMMNK
jgi:uncharacterized membrane protein YciS (DUF1049 family)